ncbi:MAG: tRNA (adenosine(37)-N6)-threonylcarbamoyltransferase complex ATPase subunit type 1 TsaE [Bacteroidota bacterium]|nr:tRNA (adenosine(37)-N6)-threonylcarbamoyltransferase complex ATPase subunit type 1 TsaE [Bacteroidota bacterium]
MKLYISSLADLPRVAREFLDATAGKKHFAFYGSMGAGKTTLIKEICHQLKVVEVVTSPTFAIVNEYHTGDNQLVYHFDFYRINKIEELFDFGYEDYLYSPNYCFIEWPEKGETVLPDHIHNVYISEQADGSRLVEF